MSLKPCSNTGRCKNMIEVSGNNRRKFCNDTCREQARKYVRINPAVDPDEVDFLGEYLKKQLLALSRYAYTLRKGETVTTVQVQHLRDRADALLTDAVARDRANGLSWRKVAESLGIHSRQAWDRYKAIISIKRNRTEVWPSERMYASLRRWAEHEFGPGAEITEIDMEHTPGDLSVAITYVIGSDALVKAYSGQESVTVIASLFKHALERALP